MENKKTPIETMTLLCLKEASEVMTYCCDESTCENCILNHKERSMRTCLLLAVKGLLDNKEIGD